MTPHTATWTTIFGAVPWGSWLTEVIRKVDDILDDQPAEDQLLLIKHLEHAAQIAREKRDVERSRGLLEEQQDEKGLITDPSYRIDKLQGIKNLPISLIASAPVDYKWPFPSLELYKDLEKVLNEPLFEEVFTWWSRHSSPNLHASSIPFVRSVLLHGPPVLKTRVNFLFPYWEFVDGERIVRKLFGTTFLSLSLSLFLSPRS